MLSKFPRFFIVDGLPVKVVLDGDEVAGFTSTGFELPPLKALNEGCEVSEERI